MELRQLQTFVTITLDRKLFQGAEVLGYTLVSPDRADTPFGK